jgi:hypothetical protein
MNGDWQDLVALLAVLAAAAYIAQRFFPWPRRKAAARCASGCSTCPMSREDTSILEPVQIGTLSKRP